MISAAVRGVHMRRLNTDGATIVKRRAAIVVASLLMILLFIALDNVPDLAVFCLIAGAIMTGTTLFALKRQIENEITRAQEAKRAEHTRAERKDSLVIEAPAVMAIPGPDFSAADPLDLEELAAGILSTEDLVSMASSEEAGSKADNGKPYVAPSYDLFD